MTQCAGTTRFGDPCSMQAMSSSDLCFEHNQLKRNAGIFGLSPAEVAERVEFLTWKQLATLQAVCNGQSYESIASNDGVTLGSVSNRISTAVRRAGVQSRWQLICLYTLYRAQKVVKPMP